MLGRRDEPADRGAGRHPAPSDFYGLEANAANTSDRPTQRSLCRDADALSGRHVDDRLQSFTEQAKGDGVTGRVKMFGHDARCYALSRLVRRTASGNNRQLPQVACLRIYELPDLIARR